MAKDNNTFNSATCDLNREIINNKIEDVEKILAEKINNVEKRVSESKQDISNCQKGVKESLNHMVDRVKSDFKEDLDKVEENLKDKISVSTQSINERIEGLDKKIRGNGGVGIDEKIRTIKNGMKKKKKEDEEKEKNIKEMITTNKKISGWIKKFKWTLYIIFSFLVFVAGGSVLGFRAPVGMIERVWVAVTYNETKEQIKKEEEKKEKEEMNIKMEEILEFIKKQEKDKKKLNNKDDR